jgi:hypothetical protein
MRHYRPFQQVHPRYRSSVVFTNITQKIVSTSFTHEAVYSRSGHSILNCSPGLHRNPASGREQNKNIRSLNPFIQLKIFRLQIDQMKTVEIPKLNPLVIGSDCKHPQIIGEGRAAPDNVLLECFPFTVDSTSCSRTSSVTCYFSFRRIVANREKSTDWSGHASDIHSNLKSAISEH